MARRSNGEKASAAAASAAANSVGAALARNQRRYRSESNSSIITLAETRKNNSGESIKVAATTLWQRAGAYRKQPQQHRM